MIKLWGNKNNKENKNQKELDMQVNYHILNDSIVLNFNGETHTINRGDGRYQDVVEAIKANDLVSIPNLVKVETWFQKRGMDLKDGILYIDGEQLPSELSDKVLAFKSEGLPFEPFLKFWENLKQNPSYNSRKMLYKFLEHNGHPLTEDGCFIAYRGVSNDFKDRHTGKFDNSVGAICEMPREQVDDNPDNTCSSGLHVACYDYAYGFGPKRVEVKVNPKDVVAVPRDYNGTKMRVCKFEVVAVAHGIRNETLHNHDSYDYDSDDQEEYYDGAPF